MTSALEFLGRAFTLNDAGWSLLMTNISITVAMIFYWVEHWPFRLIVSPGLVLGALTCNQAMTELALNVHSDKLINQAVGFGVGIVAVTVIGCSAAWVFYDVARK